MYRQLLEDNGLPIHLKGGVKDALIYRFTMALTVFGSGYVVYELFTAAMPKKAYSQREERGPAAAPDILTLLSRGGGFKQAALTFARSIFFGGLNRLIDALLTLQDQT
ncbi:hypothetical protein CgunFtcFv8_011515 [Champsocephalus gunnari]|uniref:Cytochrome c oxidase subunit 7A2, mitochondrial n=1 Tax=Champsocephalus gunnari TaxID=52237 RepID=A0AAN8D826_CHAGU|nr:hypothetical protein CgunFtcFv8_011515 [Champsocephalus gunnari]